MGGGRAIEGTKSIEDKEVIMGEVRHGMGGERKEEKENQGIEQKNEYKETC